MFDFDVLDGNIERIKISVSKEKLGLGDGGLVLVYGFFMKNFIIDLFLYCFFLIF